MIFNSLQFKMQQERPLKSESLQGTSEVFELPKVQFPTWLPGQIEL